MKVPQNSAHGDRQRPPTTILLGKSQTSQAALMPKEHRVFIKEAYSKGDPGPGARFQQTPSVPPPEEVLGLRARAGPPSKTLG